MHKTISFACLINDAALICIVLWPLAIIIEKGHNSGLRLRSFNANHSVIFILWQQWHWLKSFLLGSERRNSSYFSIFNKSEFTERRHSCISISDSTPARGKPFLQVIISARSKKIRNTNIKWVITQWEVSYELSRKEPKRVCLLGNNCFLTTFTRRCLI